MRAAIPHVQPPAPRKIKENKTHDLILVYTIIQNYNTKIMDSCHLIFLRISYDLLNFLKKNLINS